MPRSSRSGTLSIIQAAAIDDRRMGASALRVLVALGTYADSDGWCWPKQRQLAARIGVTRQAVSRALLELESYGYIEIHRQHDEATGSQIASRYRVVMEFVLADEFRRTPQPDIAGGIKVALRPPQPDVAPPATPEIAPPATSDVAPSKRPNTTTQKNDPIDIPADAPERVVFEYYRSKIQPAVRVNAPEKIRARLKTFSVEDLKRGIDNFAADAWWMEHNGTRGVAWFFHSDTRSEQFLNLTPRPAANATPKPATDAAKGWRIHRY